MRRRGVPDTVDAMKRGESRSTHRVLGVAAALLLGASSGALAAEHQAAPTKLEAAGTGLGAKKAGAWKKLALATAAAKPGSLRLRKGETWLAYGEDGALIPTKKKKKAIALVRVAATKQIGPMHYGDEVALRAASGHFLRWAGHGLEASAPGPKQALHLKLAKPGDKLARGLVVDGSPLALRTASGKYLGGSLDAPKLTGKATPLEVGQVGSPGTGSDPDAFLLYDTCAPAGCPRGYSFAPVDWLEPWNYKPVMIPFSRYTVSVMQNATTFETYACVKDIADSKCCARTTCEGSGPGASAQLSTALHTPAKAKALIDACDPEIFGGHASAGTCGLSWTCECSEPADSCQRVKQPTCPGATPVL